MSMFETRQKKYELSNVIGYSVIFGVMIIINRMVFQDEIYREYYLNQDYLIILNVFLFVFIIIDDVIEYGTPYGNSVLPIIISLGGLVSSKEFQNYDEYKFHLDWVLFELPCLIYFIYFLYNIHKTGSLSHSNSFKTRFNYTIKKISLLVFDLSIRVIVIWIIYESIWFGVKEKGIFN